MASGKTPKPRVTAPNKDMNLKPAGMRALEQRITKLEAMLPPVARRNVTRNKGK